MTARPPGGAAVPGATQEEVRRRNLSTLLRQVHLSGPLSRAELTARMGLNRSTIAGLVGDLADAGFVREQVPADRAGAGRPSLLVEPRPEAAWVVGAEVGTDAVVVARIGLGGRVLARREGPTSPCGARAGRVAGALAGLVADVLPPGPAGGLPLSVGVAVPGIVRRADGHVHLAPNLGWSDVPFGRLLRRRLGGLLGTAVPVLVGNDADLGARAEHARGAAAGSRHVVYLSGHVGLGAGVIVDGRPLSGLSGYGGEVGHVKVSTAGRSCRCGSHGCWETEAGEEALLARAGHPPDAGAGGVRAVLAEAAAGSPRAEAALAETGRWLGLGIANLVNIFNPELVVVGGVMRLVLPSVEEVVDAQLTAFALGPSRAQVRLALPALDLDSALVGAAELAFEALLADPLGALPGRGPS